MAALGCEPCTHVPYSSWLSLGSRALAESLNVPLQWLSPSAWPRNSISWLCSAHTGAGLAWPGELEKAGCRSEVIYAKTLSELGVSEWLPSPGELLDTATQVYPRKANPRPTLHPLPSASHPPRWSAPGCPTAPVGR